MKIDTAICVVLVVFIMSAFGTCSLQTWQANQTERACIAAGRTLWAGHCSDPIKPGETRIE